MDNKSNSLLMEALFLALKKMEQESQDSILLRLLHCPELQEVIRTIVKQEKSVISSVTRVKEYMHMDYFLQEYRISKKTFHQWKKNVYVHDRQQGRFKVYNVVQFEQAARSPKNNRPNFNKAA
jgi:hypothetical protein